MTSLWAGLDWNIDWNTVQAMLVELWPWLAVALGVSCWVVVERVAARWRIGRVARRLGARVTREPGRLYPVLEWNDGAREARLGFPRARTGFSLRSTVCTVDWDRRLRFSVDVRRRGLLAQAALWLPARRNEVRTGIKRFDRLFVIRSPDVDAARRWLDREVQRSLVRLARLAGGSAFRLACDGESLVTRLGGAVTARRELRLFAESAMWLARTIEAAVWDSGVQFTPSARETTSIMGPMCPACAEPAARMTSATCPICRAPHHPACWDYLGGCGVYGCDGGGAGRGHSSSPAA